MLEVTENEEEKKAQVARIVDNCYMVPPNLPPEQVHLFQSILITSHGAELLIMPPRDLLASRAGEVSTRINDALNTPKNPEDDTVLRELIALMPGEYGGRSHLLYGLYFYLTSEVSRNPNFMGTNKENKSFFTAGREVLKKYEKEGKLDEDGRIVKHEDKIQWFKDVLEELNLWRFDHMKKLVADWTTAGCFYVGEEFHCYTNKTPSGTFVKLAEETCNPQSPFARTEKAIEFALGAKQYYWPKSNTDMALIPISEAEAMEITKKFLDDAKILFSDATKSDPALLKNNSAKRAIEKGHDIRKDSLERKVESLRRNLMYKDMGSDFSNFMQYDQKRIQFFTELVSDFSKADRDFMEKARMRYIYINRKNVRNACPIEDAQGNTHKNCEDGRDAIAVFYDTNDAIFLSQGLRENSFELIRFSLKHENTHVLMGHPAMAGNPAIKAYHKAAGEVYQQLAKNAVDEVIRELQPETQNLLNMPLTGSNIVNLFPSLRPTTRYKLYDSLDFLTQMNLFLALPPKAKANLYVILPENQKSKLYNYLLPEYKFDLYMALTKESKETMYKSYGEAGKKIIDEGLKALGEEAYSAKEPYNFNIEAAAVADFNSKFSRRDFLEEIYNVLTSGNISDLNYRFTKAEIEAIDFSHEEKAALEANKDLNYTENETEADSSVIKKLSLALIKKFGAELGSINAGSDLAAYWKRPAILKLREIHVPGLGNVSAARMLDALGSSYSNYIDGQKVCEVEANTASAIEIHKLLNSLPEHEALNPIRELGALHDAALQAGIKHFAELEKERQNSLAATNTVS